MTEPTPGLIILDPRKCAETMERKNERGIRRSRRAARAVRGRYIIERRLRSKIGQADCGQGLE
jgi:hypothetical protein